MYDIFVLCIKSQLNLIQTVTNPISAQTSRVLIKVTTNRENRKKILSGEIA